MQGEFISEGKKYISASRASKICGYTSDYIGQLCRKGSLDCRMVGRSWFVEEESLKTHKVIASAAPRGRIAMYQKNAVKNTASALTSGDVSKLDSKNEFQNAEVAFQSVQQNWQDYLNEEADKKQVAQFSGKIISGVFAVVLLVAASSVVLSNKSQFVSNPISAIHSNQHVVALQSGAKEFADLFKSSKHEVGGSFSYSANVFQSFGVSVKEKIGNIFGRVYVGLADIRDFFFDASRKVRVLVMNSGSQEKGVNGGHDRTGVAVVPASDDEDVNERVKQYVTDSFSDEARIIPDESGNSGVIKPVFKENTDQEYLYVIVPVKENAN